MAKFSYSDFEEVISDNFEDDFVEGLLKYVTEIKFKKFIKYLINNIKQTISYIETEREIKGNIINDNIIKEYVKLINFKGKLDFKSFLKIIYSVPAFIPLLLLLLETSVYLNRISNRQIFINSISININKTGLLRELWDNNLDVGSFFEESYQEVFPTLKQQWEKYPEIQDKCEIFSFLYLSFKKAVYLPLKKMEDRLIMDINTLLDTYFYTTEENTSYDFCGGPRMIPDASDKLNSIMIGNVYKPDKYKKKEEENEAYINAYADYEYYKFWYTRLKYISKYFDAKKNNTNIIPTYKYIDFNQNDLNLLEMDYKLCIENSKVDLLEYIMKSDKFLYTFFTSYEYLSNSNKIISYIRKTSKKTFALNVIKTKYNLLYKKSDKRIQNKFVEFNKIVKDIDFDSNVYEQLGKEKFDVVNDFLKSYYIDNSDRFWEFDDKENETDELKSFIPKFKILYYLFEQYIKTPNELLYKAINQQIKHIAI